jgi:hypothetical protein
MNYVSLSLTNTMSSVHLHALYSHRTALRTFTPRRDQLVICGQYVSEPRQPIDLLFITQMIFEHASHD